MAAETTPGDPDRFHVVIPALEPTGLWERVIGGIEPSPWAREVQDRTHRNDMEYQPKGRSTRSESQDQKPTEIDYSISPDAEDKPCTACPFQSRRRWVDTRRRWPDLFAEAVETDAREAVWPGVRQGAVLVLAADASRRGEAPRRWTDGFGNECEGHCGV